jgi:hypothetical protein
MGKTLNLTLILRRWTFFILVVAAAGIQRCGPRIRPSQHSCGPSKETRAVSLAFTTTSFGCQPCQWWHSKNEDGKHFLVVPQNTSSPIRFSRRGYSFNLAWKHYSIFGSVASVFVSPGPPD